MNIALSQHVEDALVQLTIAGEVNRATSDLVYAAIRSALMVGRPTVIVDLDRVSVVDSAGIAALVEAHRAAAEHDTVLHVRHPHGQVEEALRGAGVLHILTGT